MKTSTRAVGIIALALISLLASAPAPVAGQTKEAVTAVVAETPDPGSLKGSNYRNKYFGLTFTIPSGWSVQDSGARKQLSARGKEFLTSTDAAEKVELDRAVDSTLNLLTVTEHAIGSGAFNSMLICGAEKPASGVKTDVAYMLALKNTLQFAQVPITIEKDVYAEQIGGVTFSVIDFNTNYSGVIVSQRYYAHIVRNYVLFFIIIYKTPEQLKTLMDTLRTVRLQ